ncbi:tripartite tricarboxylate transporter TctB family protein [Rhizobium sp. AU243]|uniref:tripartite tricarboxylate transporter TctB family protein n=1 Tax=Rhizobium sp. AU243 TaxID=2303425 RepID=UPI0010CB70C6|nr:tripartite tricarboxylate transporter TctB family protein [Rhizobium sp. AU243]TKV70799.1 tripartite tricarboxylate transporter TctB family protein [Rhizobium sp. AU243]
MSNHTTRTRTRLRSPQNLLAGIGLLVLAMAGLHQSFQLDIGFLRAVGPGLLPIGLSILLAIIGIGLVAVAFIRSGEPLSGWSWRGPIFLCLAAIAFAMTIRTPGLAVAGPLVALLSGSAARDVRPRELAIFTVLGTAGCVALFKIMLGLPIPVLTIPGVFYW